MSELLKLSENSEFFRYFLEISKIPHGSDNCGRIADYICGFAKEKGLPCYRDAADNLLITKEATEGYENHPAVIIQGHIDMVAEKTPESKRDLLNEGIEVLCDGEYLYAKDTTLGGDDGIAVAYAMAILADDTLKHPKIEALFTSDEEIGLIGASQFDTSRLTGKTLINIDSEEEGIFTVGCAGGVRVDMPLLDADARVSVDGAYKLTVSGLFGGHSGVEIHKGRANAAKLISRVLLSLGDIRLCSIVGGNMDNAIMRSAEAVFHSDMSFDTISRIVTLKAQLLREAYLGKEEDISLAIEPLCGEFSAFSKEDTARITAMIDTLPSSVVKMSENIEGLPESSANIGIVRIDAEGDDSYVTASLRSENKEGKLELIDRLYEICELYGFDISLRGDYPGWAYRKDSVLRDTARALYIEKYGKEPEILTIHAGLECGIFADRIEGLDCISIGPDMSGIHTTEEKLSVKSSIRVYDFVCELIARM